MQKYLFVDNFRGFQNTYAPLLDVNFLVGENSTGKTSLLGLLKLIASQKVLLHQDFGDEDVSFGNFGDIVSAHAKDRSYFRIGFVQETDEKREEIRVTAALFTYEQYEGLPRISKFTATLGNQEISLRFDGRTVGYRTAKTLSPETRADDMVRTIMPRWAREHAANEAKYGTPPQSASAAGNRLWSR
jgi:predicted ATP-dependent endonuclease of OLD family